MTDYETVKEDVRYTITELCKYRTRAGLCNENECEFCCVNRTYEMCDSAEYIEEDYK